MIHNVYIEWINESVSKYIMAWKPGAKIQIFIWVSDSVFRDPAENKDD